MKKGLLFFAAGAILCTLSLSCNKDKKEDPKSAFSNQNAHYLWTEKDSEEAEIKVVNQYNEPIASAQILIGDAQGAPFRNNFVTTDRLGAAQVPSEWTTEAAVTVEAKGFIRQTLLNQKPGNIVVKLNPAFLPTPIELTGQVTQMPVVNGDKLIDFALVMPALSKSDLLNFDINQVISPYSDKLTAAGMSNDMPSNISLPKQSENYFFNITLEKPVYRLKVPTTGMKRFVAARGRFVFKTVVDELRSGKPFYELINYFSILGGGMRDTTLTGGNSTLDISGTELTFNSTIKINPTMPQSDEVMLVLAASEIGGTMMPTDIKKITSNQPLTLQSLATQKSYAITVVKKQSEFMSPTGRMSASLLPVGDLGTNSLLPLVNNPTVTNNGNYVIQSTTPTISGIFPLATTAIISDLIEANDGDKKITLTTKRWEVIGAGWGEKINLPNWPLPGANSKRRFEINFVGSTTATAPIQNGNFSESATHVTHAAIDL